MKLANFVYDKKDITETSLAFGMQTNFYANRVKQKIHASGLCGLGTGCSGGGGICGLGTGCSGGGGICGLGTGCSGGGGICGLGTGCSGS